VVSLCIVDWHQVSVCIAYFVSYLIVCFSLCTPWTPAPVERVQPRGSFHQTPQSKDVRSMVEWSYASKMQLKMHNVHSHILRYSFDCCFFSKCSDITASWHLLPLLYFITFRHFYCVATGSMLLTQVHYMHVHYSCALCNMYVKTFDDASKVLVLRKSLGYITGAGWKDETPFIEMYLGLFIERAYLSETRKNIYKLPRNLHQIIFCIISWTNDRCFWSKQAK